MPVWLTVAIGFVGFLDRDGDRLRDRGAHKKTSWVPIASSSPPSASSSSTAVSSRNARSGARARTDSPSAASASSTIASGRRAGIDPDQIGVGQPFGAPLPGATVPRPAASAHDDPGEPTENPAHYLGLLEELHDTGVLDDTEYNEARTRLLEQLR